MLNIKKQKYKIPYYQKWFGKRIDRLDAFRIVSYIQSDTTRFCLGFIRRYSLTLQTSLLQSPEEIFNQFSATVKNEIRRSIRENICNKEISVGEFLDLYTPFAKQMGLLRYSIRDLSVYGERIVYTGSFIGTKLVVAHAYVTDKESGLIRLAHSCSLRIIIQEDISSAQISRANRGLHFFDINLFRQQIFTLYDWGGIATGSKLAGIRKFKEGFGGNQIKCTHYDSVLYRLMMKITNIF